MKQVYYDYDVYPKVFLGDREKTVTVKPLGIRTAFAKDKAYTVEVLKVNQGNMGPWPERSGRTTLSVTPDEDGFLRVTAYFEGEGEYYLNINDGDRRLATLPVYCLAEDMAGRIPQRGDLHVHTCRSDGHDDPVNVVSNYRGHGYDFMVISDHNRYYPSLEAIQRHGGVSDIAIIPGEEVHLPHNDVHYVNFGGTYSINALVAGGPNDEKAGDDLAWRSLDGKAPDRMTREEFTAMIQERAARVPLEHHSERMSFAVLEWTFEHMEANGGLGIFPHPYWLCQLMQLPEEYTEFIYRNKPFHAFEVLGGENYYTHNGFQTALYYEMREKGIDHPVVGSTDSHNSSAENNRNSLICSTIVFAKENTREGLVSAIKDKYSVAVDTISTEYRLVGDFRWIRYGAFLMENYFPIHDEVCRAEGHILRRHFAGDKQATAILAAMKGQMPALQKKYFDL